MKKIILLMVLLTTTVQMSAMDLPSLEVNPKKRKEISGAELPPSKEAHAEPEQSLLNALPNEIKVNIIKFLANADDSPEGEGAYGRLFAAVKNIRALAATNRSLYAVVNDPNTTDTLIKLLAQRYTGNNPIIVVAALKTTAALEWFNKFLERAMSNPKLKEIISHTLAVSLTLTDPTSYLWISDFIMDHVPSSILKIEPIVASKVLAKVAADPSNLQGRGFDSIHLKKIISYFISSSGITINTPRDDRHGIFYYAIANNNLDLLKIILMYPSVNVNLLDPSEGETPLATAVYFNRFEAIILLLLNPDVDVNIQDQDGITPLMRIVRRVKKDDKRSFDIAFLLITRPGIKINLRNAEGLTALDYLYRQETLDSVQRRLLKMMVDRGAKLGMDIEPENDIEEMEEE